MLATSSIEAESLEPVKLTVSDESGVARIREAVCSGVPFAQAALRTHQPMHVRGPAGAIPTQTRVLGTWPDGSVKWLLVQFLADCPANTDCVYDLVPGDAPLSKPRLRTENRRDAIVVDTGPLRVEMPKNSLALFRSVQLRGATESVRILDDVSPMRFALSDGSVHTSSGVEPEIVELEETGPIRATVRQVGWLQDAAGNRSYKVDMRLRFYDGQAYVKAEQTFICLGQPELHQISEIAVDFTPGLGAEQQFILPADAGTIEAEARQRPFGHTRGGRRHGLQIGSVAGAARSQKQAGWLGGASRRPRRLRGGDPRLLAPGTQIDRVGRRETEARPLERPQW